MLEKNGLKTSIRPAAGENDYETVRSHDGHRLVETVLVKDYDKVCVHLEIAESFDWNMANAVEVQLTLISTKPLRSEVIKMPPTQKQISLDLETFKIWDPATKYWKDASFQFVPIQDQEWPHWSYASWFKHAGSIVVGIRRVIRVEGRERQPWPQIPFAPVQPGTNWGFERPGLRHTIGIANSSICSLNRLYENVITRPISGYAGIWTNFTIEFRSAEYVNILRTNAFAPHSGISIAEPSRPVANNAGDFDGDTIVLQTTPNATRPPSISSNLRHKPREQRVHLPPPRAPFRHYGPDDFCLWEVPPYRKSSGKKSKSKDLSKTKTRSNEFLSAIETSQQAIVLVPTKHTGRDHQIQPAATQAPQANDEEALAVSQAHGRSPSVEHMYTRPADKELPTAPITPSMPRAGRQVQLPPTPQPLNTSPSFAQSFKRPCSPSVNADRAKRRREVLKQYELLDAANAVLLEEKTAVLKEWQEIVKEREAIAREKRAVLKSKVDHNKHKRTRAAMELEALENEEDTDFI
ncbi:MAG: hypothetical protein MMC23_001264 [Stictis urceolatum]|nr:hypothetical protein [Stictis urceolata]